MSRSTLRNMLLAHRIELRPTPEQADYLNRACGARRHCYEDLNVKGMVKNRKLSRAVSDAGLGMLRAAIEYKARLRGGQVIVADRWFPSSRTCSGCGQIHDMPLDKRKMECDCGLVIDRDINAAKNLEQYGRLTLLGDLKRAQESSKSSLTGVDVDGVNMSSTGGLYMSAKTFSGGGV